MSIGSGDSTPQCCTDKELADALTKAMDQIDATLEKINDTLGKQVKSCDSIVGDCLDSIATALKKKWEKGVKSADECQRMAKEGQAGTIEYVLSCATNTVNECKESCSLGDGAVDGDCCKTCGQPNCICKDGECVPRPETTTPPSTQKYVGWCNKKTGIWAVIPEGDPSPGVDYEQVQTPTDQETAQINTAAICASYQSPTPTIEFPSFPSLNSPYCDVGNYADGQAGVGFAANSANIELTADVIAFIQATLQAGEQGTGFLGPYAAAFGFANSLTSLPFQVSKAIAPNLAQAFGCQGSGFVGAYNLLAVVGWLNRQTGVDTSVAAAPYQYAINSACRNRLLSPDQAMTAFLADAIDTKTLKTYWDIAGYCDNELEKVIEASASKPLPNDLAVMRRRKLISGQEYTDRMRQIGYPRGRMAEALYEIKEQLPTLSDIISLMVRDADDNTVVQKFGLDAEFTNKYGGQLKEWSEKQGVPELFAKYAWRAHWTIPSPTALFTFYHRLRDNPKYGGRAKVLDNIKTALIQQDILPFWHDYYLDTSFLPMGRVDIRRSYQIGEMKDSELEPAYRQLGYSDDDSARLAKFSIRLRNQSIQTHRYVKQWIALQINKGQLIVLLRGEGYPQLAIDDALDIAEVGFSNSKITAQFKKGLIDRATLIAKLTTWGVSNRVANQIADTAALEIHQSPALNEYIVGTKTEQQARTDMATAGMDPAIISNLVDKANAKIDSAFVSGCVSGLRRRFIYGELDNQQAVNELTRIGVVLQRANRMVQNWQCQMSARGRTFGAAKLCEWLAMGLITQADYSQRLQKLGYDSFDAARVTQSCSMNISARLQKQAKKEAEDQARQEARIARENLRITKAEIAAIAARERSNNQRASAVQRREKSLLTSADNLRKTSQADLNSSLSTVKSVYNSVRNNFALSVDESIQVVAQAVTAFEGKDLSQLQSLADMLAQGILDASLVPPLDESTNVAILNGFTQPSS